MVSHKISLFSKMQRELFQLDMYVNILTVNVKHLITQSYIYTYLIENGTNGKTQD